MTAAAGSTGVVPGMALFDRATAVLCPCGEDLMAVRWAVPIPEGERGRGAIDRECGRCGLSITIEVEARTPAH